MDRRNSTIDKANAPEHGGKLSDVIAQYGIPKSAWLDLSTGISPFAFPIPPLDQSDFTDLPYIEAGHQTAAERYYLGDKSEHMFANHSLLITPGSQLTIAALPKILANCPVLLPSQGYQEHAFAWKQQTMQVDAYESTSADVALQQITEKLSANAQQHLVIINPNNPTTLSFTHAQLIDLAQQIHAPGMMIVDEAFIDFSPEDSLLRCTLPENVIIIRSLGKFFGLAGLRVGTVIAPKETAQKLSTLQGPWPVAGASLAIACKAWEDKSWQTKQRERLILAHREMLSILAPLTPILGSPLSSSSQLFLTFRTTRKTAKRCHKLFAENGVLLRLIAVDENTSLLRFGLFDHTNEQQREKVLTAIQTVCGRT